eukprot:CAMPEP_0177640158 /NCGR_PEP_ID=MMETSP0447-20121125/6397_1 /TAXON_ID=0 /ORGANISM="Stygamoeba regulata, Strain BSH-02190019" /LENGTH=457 /DNA_ID=CAMNT_0019142217 /DNA_START=144 /DNA_END=1514 /DNA_ORIENTATION=-
MCSLLVLTLATVNLLLVNNPAMIRRGPDATHYERYRGVLFLHNLLHLTGDFTKQPFVYQEDDVVALFNGEIYNYKDFGDSLPSDGYCLFPAYKKYGENFPSYLDGEFAIVLFDFKKGIAIVSSDIFGIKPLWYSVENGEFGVATFESPLKLAGFAKPVEVEPNTVHVFDIFNKYALLRSHKVHTFNTDQYKMDLTDWNAAFENAVWKRAGPVKFGLFIGLSSGYDSGAIAAALTKMKIRHRSFSVVGRESRQVIEDRTRFAGNLTQLTLIDLSLQEFDEAKKVLAKTGEDYLYGPEYEGGPPVGMMFSVDRATVGLAHVCTLANKENLRIYVSGSGADEIHSDYGFQGKKFYPHSCFGGLFPEDLSTVFPWYSVFNGTQRNYLRKDEHVGGNYAVEARFPFLDKALVQEFLNLHPTIKNSAYKRPIRDYMQGMGYPVLLDQKVGFSTLNNFQVVINW